MTVQKRSGCSETVSFDKILERLGRLGSDLSINHHDLSKTIIDQLYDGIATSKLDELGAEQCAAQCTEHPDYGVMAGRLTTSNLQKDTPDTFSAAVHALASATDSIGEKCPVVDEWFSTVIHKHAAKYDEMIDHDRDYLLSYFGLKTLIRSYLLRVKSDGITRIIERPQYMWMRVAVAIHKEDFDAVKNTYDLLSTLRYTHGTPTLYNSGTSKQQMSSCYLLAMQDDSIEGIFETLKQSALISKWAGGQGLHIHNVRGQYAHIRGTNGESNGLVPMLRVFNNMARYVDQGGGKRPGAIAIYLSPDHIDVMPWLDLRKNHGSEDERARDLFYGLWIPDLFMERVEAGANWTMMCPDSCPGLADVYGANYVKLYEQYEHDVISGKRRGTTLPARDVWFKILDSQIETGTPYMLYKDAANSKSNQKNLGTIKSSNLCTEIIEYSDVNETAVCNLASVSLPQFVTEEGYDFDGLHSTVKTAAKNLDRIITINFYPVESTRRSNLRHRPIGLGVQGLADVFFKMRMPFESKSAAAFNVNIFETIYHAALEASWELAEERKRVAGEDLLLAKRYTETDIWQMNCSTNDGYWCKGTHFSEEELHKLPHKYCGAYSSFVGSPMHNGQFQFDLWNITPSDRYDWDALRQKIACDGIRNSLSVAPMPTASTAQILGNTEAFEPITSNMYVRRVGSGDFPVVNKHLLNDLIERGMWNKETKDSILLHNGSVQQLDIPQELKDLYKTAWEVKMKSIIDMSAERAPYVCQSQSLNMWMEDPEYSQMTAMHMHAWKSGLKTGMYYFRTRAKAKPQQFTVEPTAIAHTVEAETACDMCSA